MRTAVLSCLFALGFLVCVISTEAASTSTAEKTPFITHDAIFNLMKEALDRTGTTMTDFASARNPLDGNPNREGMKEFIAFKMSQVVGMAGGGEEGHKVQQDSFSTQILTNNNIPIVAHGTNVIAILQGSNPAKKDKPLLIVANYDTDVQANGVVQRNFVEDNGAGVAAMLVLANFIAQELKAGAYKLENTVVFVATDLSYRRYSNSQGGHIPPNATTGSDRIAQKFLPEFLGDRQFRGAIVLDKILNYNEEPNSEKPEGFSKTYPEAYQIMSHSKFTGNFLGLVSRPTDLDKDIKNGVQRGWEKALKQRKDSEGSLAQIEPNLIVFEHTAEDESGEPFLYFLQSDQYSFWNHHLRASPSYPAVLLTDTGIYRDKICSTCSRIEDSTKPENLAFAHRTILTLYNVVKELQTSAGSGSRITNIPTGISMITLMTICLRYVMTSL